MSYRTKHLFQFSANKIAEAAKAEAEYHEMRVKHWRDRYHISLTKVRDSAKVVIAEHEVSGGEKVVGASVDFGDQSAWDECQLAQQKIRTHKVAADRYRTDQNTYSTQSDRAYELDTEDVHHFRLGGQPREE